MTEPRRGEPCPTCGQTIETLGVETTSVRFVGDVEVSTLHLTARPCRHEWLATSNRYAPDMTLDPDG